MAHQWEQVAESGKAQTCTKNQNLKLDMQMYMYTRGRHYTYFAPALAPHAPWHAPWHAPCMPAPRTHRRMPIQPTNCLRRHRSIIASCACHAVRHACHVHVHGGQCGPMCMRHHPQEPHTAGRFPFRTEQSPMPIREL